MKKKTLHIFLNIAVVEAFLCGIWLLLIPSGVEEELSFQLSPQRLLLLLPLLLSFFGLSLIWILSKKSLINLIDAKKKNLKIWQGVNILRIALFLLNLFVLLVVILAPIFLTPENEVYLFSNENPFIPRIMPLLAFFIVFGIQVQVFLGFLFREKSNKAKRMDLISVSVLLFGFLFVLCVFSVSLIFGWGIEVYDGWIADWGVPILEWQVVVLLFTILHAYLFIQTKKQFSENRSNGWKKDWLIFFLIWIIAFSAWMFVLFDYDGSYFYANPAPPTYELFPFSDARQYNSASVEFLTGDGSDNSFARQYYVLFLAFGNWLFNYNIEKIVFLQVIFLSLIPSILYWFTTRFNERLVGIFLATIIILREVLSIRNAGAINTTPVRMLMSDMSCLLLVAICLYYAIRWCNAIDKRKRNLFALIMGAMLGINIAMRIYVIVFVPVVIVLFFFFQKDRKQFWKEIFSFGLGLTTTILPIIIRNYIATGIITLERPIFWDHFMNFSSLSNTTSVSEISPSLIGIIQNLLGNLGPLFIKTMNHFINDLFSTWMTFFAMSKPVDGTYFYYHLPSIGVRWANFHTMRMIIGFIIAILSIVGVSRLFKRHKKSTILLISFYFTYAFGMAWVGASGWRFILPVDWIGLFFVLLGIIQLFDIIFFKLFLASEKEKNLELLQEEKKSSKARYFIVFASFLLLASIYLIRDTFFVNSYQNLSSKEICAEIVVISSDIFCHNLEEEGFEFYKGIMLYPQYYSKGIYIEQEKDRNPFTKHDFNRYTFTIIGNVPKNVYLKATDETYSFANGMEIVIAVKKSELGWEANIVYDLLGEKLYISNP